MSIPPNHPTATDAIVWTVPEGSSDAASGEWAQPGEGTYKSMLITSLGKLLKHHVKVVEPDEAEFASTLVQAHRKAEKALHVKAFRGSKDGKLHSPSNADHLLSLSHRLPLLPPNRHTMGLQEASPALCL